MKRLIVTADDFGLTPGVVEGIIEAHERGIVTATSLMVNAPAADEAFRYARRDTSLAIGLHFVLTFGAPTGPVERLGNLVDNDGRFRKTDSGAHASASREQVEEELAAQIERFHDATGRAPSHIDGHHHVHALPGVLPAVIDEARRLDIPVRMTEASVRTTLRRASVRTSDAFIDAFYGEGHVGIDELKARLTDLEDGTTELMCHPGRPNDAMLASLSSYVEPRAEELHTLTADGLHAWLRGQGVELAGAA